MGFLIVLFIFGIGGLLSMVYLILAVLWIISPKWATKWATFTKVPDVTRKRAVCRYLLRSFLSFAICIFAIWTMQFIVPSAEQKQEIQVKKSQEKELTAPQKKELTAPQQAELKAQKEAEEKQRQEAKIQAEKEKMQSIIRVSKLWTSDPNSAGGVDLHIVWQNKSDKPIKYCTFNVVPYNAVNDIMECRIRGRSEFVGTVTGPIEPGGWGDNGRFWSCAWYNRTITRAELFEINIEYMDGSRAKVPFEYAQSVIY